jgi:hypothetical protein
MGGEVGVVDGDEVFWLAFRPGKRVERGVEGEELAEVDFVVMERVGK